MFDQWNWLCIFCWPISTINKLNIVEHEEFSSYNLAARESDLSRWQKKRVFGKTSWLNFQSLKLKLKSCKTIKISTNQLSFQLIEWQTYKVLSTSPHSPKFTPYTEHRSQRLFLLQAKRVIETARTIFWALILNNFGNFLFYSFSLFQLFNCFESLLFQMFRWFLWKEPQNLNLVRYKHCKFVYAFSKAFSWWCADGSRQLKQLKQAVRRGDQCGNDAASRRSR